MKREFIRVWGLTALGLVLTHGGMVCLRILVFDLYDPADGLWVALSTGLGASLLLGLAMGLVSASLSISWLEHLEARRRRSGTLTVGLTAGLVAIYAVDLMGSLPGLGVVLGFIVVVHLLDAASPVMLRGLAAIALVLLIHTLFQSQTYRILRARHTVRFVEMKLAHLKARTEPIPATLEDLNERLGLEARLHGIRSIQKDPWKYDYHYVIDPEDGSHVYLSWGADGLPGPDPNIDPDTPGADIDLRAAMGLARKSSRPPPKIRVTPTPPTSEAD